MPALAPYIPARQTQFSAWLANFSSLITASPLSYGLVAGDATIIAGYNSQWVAAVTPVLSGNTRTPAAVSNKNTVLAQILPLIRNYAQTHRKEPWREQRGQDCVGPKSTDLDAFGRFRTDLGSGSDVPIGFNRGDHLAVP